MLIGCGGRARGQRAHATLLAMKLDSALLVLPAALAITTFAAVACETGPSEGDGGDEVADAETGAGEGCYQIADMADCEADATCNWDLDFEQCLPDCTVYTDEESCNAIEGCGWDTVEGCLGPFV